MNIYINDQIENLPEEIRTLEELLTNRKIPSAGTAVAINARIIRRESWASTMLNENDCIMIISAAYGG